MRATGKTVRQQTRRHKRKSDQLARVTPLANATVAREDAAIDAYHAKRKVRAPAPTLKFERKPKDGALVIDNSHLDPRRGGMLLANALGCGDPDFIAGLIAQIVHVTAKGQEVSQELANFMLSAIKGVEPKDDVEAMLAAQMAATHMLSMTFARRLNNVESIPQQDSASQAFNKLSRTFATQVEALKRYRTGGEQRVTVQHVNVSDGGQAIVGDVLAMPKRQEGEG
ncbi:hypothetical protein BDHH15_09210 [Bradyrhizobium diazoefficiens]|uniref:Uncharacterized protein n=2 Tax=Bradyrhizobium diazoefficiens TaxID=1355477 RepID=A0A810BTW4_9BRAD|nr:hypothetical protein H12S4_09280 [Bradyrhizobium diazoefficiens]BCA17706.1 hypothetical protein BDHH15_09210 [Bradyrhizobium diazoefficiens]BCE79494.1 hypothetical protein XF9B_09150 [Bradyrhizobium diazoefficiens]BCE96894.1 hypothetical protein XF11B_09150 [Bradyrhizobium diazoefficiens]BCF05545.1 hypothetical protein XF12B_09180 [Bradyrhizobium diazoefficiens]